MGSNPTPAVFAPAGTYAVMRIGVGIVATVAAIAACAGSAAGGLAAGIEAVHGHSLTLTAHDVYAG